LVEVFGFCLAVASRNTGVVLHAFTVMSNHWHAVLTDTEGRLPEFAEWLHKYVAKCMNCVLGRSENFWSPAHYNAVVLTDREDVLDKIIYTLANPVMARLVPRARGWAGLRSTPRSHMDGPVHVRRPQVYFREDGELPAMACLKVEKPPLFVDVPDQAYAELVGSALRRCEAAQRRRVARDGGGFLGMRKIRKQSPFSAARATEKMFGLEPRIACRNRERRCEAIRKMKSFLGRYREALRMFVKGAKEVVFPAGTYWMRRYMGVVCAEP
jgi:hypothetical protein